MHKKFFGFALFMLMSLVALSGCSLLNNLPNYTPQVGSVKVQIDIPSQFLNGTQQYVSHTISLAEVIINVSKGTETYTQTKPVGEMVDVYFDSLAIGTWTIEVLVKDVDGFTVYTGYDSGNVIANSTTSVPVVLLIQNGGLDLDITFGPELGVVAGDVFLTNPGDGTVSTKPLVISGTTASASFISLKSSTWQMVAELRNAAGVEVAHAEVPVDVLPGRTMVATANATVVGGELQVAVSWVLPPTPPMSCGAMVAGPNMAIGWEMSTTPNVVGYMLYRSTSENGPKQYVSSEMITGYQCIDYNIKEGETYWYWVQAFDHNGLCSDLTSATPVFVGDRSKILAEWHAEDGNIDICMMNVDGSSIIRLTSGSECEYNASWSKDGMHVLYQTYEPTDCEIYIKKLATGEQINLTNTPAVREWNPVYSPDGTKIIFNREENFYSDIYLMDADGQGQINLTNTPNRYESFAKISPDGTKVAYLGSDAAGWRAYTMNIDGSNQQQLPFNYGAKDLAWSPDSTKLAFEGVVLDETGGWTDTTELWVINADGTNPVKILAFRSDPCFPSWSPDGSKIVFGCDEDWNYQWDLFVVNPDGTGLTKLAETACLVEAPVYTTDGSKIYFGGADGDSTVDICGINADGTGYTNLTPNTVGFSLRYPKRSWF